MRNTTINEIEDQPEGLVAKRPYQQPKLQIFGKVLHLTQGSNGNGNDGDQVHTKHSDRRVKEHIVQVDTHPLGFGLHLFDYKSAWRNACGHGRQFGVIADEVEAIMPEAVSVNSEGYKQVNYAMLGIQQAIRNR